MTDRTHPDSGRATGGIVEQLQDRISDLEAQLEAIGAGGVSGPLMGQPQAMPDLSQLTERGAKAWTGVDAQGLRGGGADMSKERDAFIRWHMDYLLTDEMLAAHVWDSQHRIAAAWQARASLSANAGSEPVYQARYQKGFWQDSSRERCEYLQNPENTCAEDWETRILYTRPPTSAEGVEHG